MKPLPCLRLLAVLTALAAPNFSARAADWAGAVGLPPGERKLALFNGHDLRGWQGQTNRYWSVVDGTIRGANTSNVPASTYLFTTNQYRNFRLLFEVKQTRGRAFSPMHSAIAALGTVMTDKGDPYSFKGPLLMFCNDWGIWDANRRNRIMPAGHNSTWQQAAERVGDWNQIEILVIGDRLRMALNGRLVFDFTDKPGMLQPSPIGLQLHSNNRPQEWHFRGLVLAENPKDLMATVIPVAP